MFDIIVVGAGHAGVEAAVSAAKLGVKVALVTANFNNVATLPCNPSIGGPAKGIVVKEIDALGGLMGRVADLTSLQFKMLNQTKGPGVWSLRTQVDKIAYSKKVKEIIFNTQNLTMVEGLVQELIVKDHTVQGIKLNNNEILSSKKVILTTGTYMNSLVMVGSQTKVIGPDDEATSQSISNNLKALGLELFRLKTGTPARIKRNSIDFSLTEIQPGSEEFYAFSYQTTPQEIIHPQVPCYLTYTTLETQKIILDNLEKSSMYSGVVKGVGPRYCPSIEDKIVRFQDKNRHQLFLEPESLELDTIYVAGLSTSMPFEVQDQLLKSIPCLKNSEVVKYGYAIEYDAINPLQLKPTLELKNIKGLYSAGQINGTSGYEEAACQGLLAGINAVLSLHNKEPFVLRRDEAYIGVLIDDLVTKGTQEPYRLLTSRAEYRLLLRHDNADLRLTEYGYKLGLVSKQQYHIFNQVVQEIEALKTLLNQTYFNQKSEINKILKSEGWSLINQKISASEFLKRPEIHLSWLLEVLEVNFSQEAIIKSEVIIKYAGYIDKAKREAEKLVSMEKLMFPSDFDFLKVPHLSLEARQKLLKVQPLTLGQASRISGVNPADISVIAMYLEKRRQTPLKK